MALVHAALRGEYTTIKVEQQPVQLNLEHPMRGGYTTHMHYSNLYTTMHSCI
jgi:hypothetical protein